jgi:hypothetical protein
VTALLEIIDPSYLKTQLSYLDLSITGLRDALRGTGNKTLTDLDTDLSNIYARLDVALSTRSSESTLSALSGKFPSAAALGDALSNPTTTIIGGALLGWDSAGSVWERVYTDGSNRLKVQLDAAPNPSNLDITLSALRDALRGTGNKTLTDLDTDLSNIYARLDVALSTRASETTLSGLSGKLPSAVALADNLSNPTTTIIGVANLGWDGTYWRRLAADTTSRLRTVVESVANPSNLDVALSTRASETTLSGLSGKFPSAAALGDALANPTTTIIGGALLGFDGTNWGRVAVKALDIIGATGRALAIVNFLTPSRMPYMVDDISVSTTEANTAIAAPGGKIIKITNKGDTDVLIGINGSVPTSNPWKVRARTAKIFLFSGATSISYKTSTGSTVISIEYMN